MCGHTKSDKIKNAVIREKVGVTFVADKMRKARLKWFEHVQRRCTDVTVRCERMVVGSIQRCKGRPKKYWGEVIRQDMTQLHITENVV